MKDFLCTFMDFKINTDEENAFIYIYSASSTIRTTKIILIETKPGLRKRSLLVGGGDVTGNVYVYIACLLLSLTPVPQPPNILVHHCRPHTIFSIEILLTKHRWSFKFLQFKF